MQSGSWCEARAPLVCDREATPANLTRIVEVSPAVISNLPLAEVGDVVKEL